MDEISGAIEINGVTEGVTNPSFLAVDPNQRFLYSVGETKEFEGRPGGSIHAFSIDRATGELHLLNEQPSHGKAPCYLTVAPQGGHVLVANYWGESITIYPVRDDGSLASTSNVVRHEGSSVNPERQQEPHPHCVMLGAAGRYAFVPDLGLDRVMIYEFDAERCVLESGTPAWIEVGSGAGPRHFVFHPDGNKAYVINELDSTLMAFAYDASRGLLEETQTVSTLPDDFKGENYAADVHVAPSGRYVYGSNRGHDSIVVFAVSGDSGTLTPIQHQSAGGEWPRNFVIDPTGQYLLVANQKSDRIVVFAVNSETGELAMTGRTIDVPSPVCLQFVSYRP